MYKINFELDEKAYKENFLDEDETYNQPKEDFIDYEKVYKYFPYYAEADIRNSIIFADGIPVGRLPDQAAKKLHGITYPFRLFTHIFGGPVKQYFEEENKVYSDTEPFIGRLEIEKI